MIDDEKIISELLERIEMLETMVNDLRWRMNQVCNKLSMEDDEPKECEHESDGLLYTSFPPQFKCTKCGEFYR